MIKTGNMTKAAMPLWKWILLLVAGSVLFYLLYGCVYLVAGISESNVLQTLLLLCCAVAMLGLYAGFVRLGERRQVKELDMRRLPVHIGLGFLAGALIFSLSVLVFVLLGYYKVLSVGCDAMGLVRALAAMLMVATCEEVIFRGVIFRMIDDRFGIWAAMIVSALIFGFMHIMNPGATVLSSVFIAIEAGILLGAAYKYTGTLWFPIGIHWAWNFFEGHVFGFPVSGGSGSVSLLSSEMHGPELMTGGAFGPEASIVVPVICLSLAIFLLWRSRHRA